MTNSSHCPSPIALRLNVSTKKAAKNHDFPNSVPTNHHLTSKQQKENLPLLPRWQFDLNRFYFCCIVPTSCCCDLSASVGANVEKVYSMRRRIRTRDPDAPTSGGQFVLTEPRVLVLEIGGGK
jgi:hypothetical protein